MISVLIPAWNAAETLPGCLQSVSGCCAEVVVVDDGSVDGTASVASAFPGVVLVRQSNRGVSAARNAALERAQGEYVVFLDADDRLKDGALKRLSAALDSRRPDIVVMRSFGPDSEKYPWSRLFVDGKLCTKKEVVRSGYLRGSVCGCAFRKDFLEAAGLSFAEGVPLSEDLVFMSDCLSVCESVLFRDIPFYQVCERTDSATRKVDPDFVRKSSPALVEASVRVRDPALYASTCRSIILGMIHRAAPAGYSPSRFRKESGLDKILPLPVVPGGHPAEIWLVNRCFPLYFRLKQLRDRCLRR